MLQSCGECRFLCSTRELTRLSSSCKFWLVFRGYGSISVQFSKPLRRYLYLHCVGSPRWPGWDLGGGLPHRSWRRALPAPQTRQSGFSRSFLPSTPFWTWGCAGVQASRCEKTKHLVSFILPPRNPSAPAPGCSAHPVQVCSCTQGERRALHGKDLRLVAFHHWPPCAPSRVLLAFADWSLWAPDLVDPGQRLRSSRENASLLSSLLRGICRRKVVPLSPSEFCPALVHQLGILE